jgi:hypothetical protein
MMLTRALTDDEALILGLYRRAAGRVLDRLGSYSTHKFEARILRKDLPDEADLIPEAQFIALLVAFRVVYAAGEPTNFGRVANILHRAGTDEIRVPTARFRSGWSDIPKRQMLVSINEEHFNPEGILNTWMNGEVFHQDEELIHRVDLLKELGPFAQFMLQWTVRDMCFPLLGLDNVCAMALGQEMRLLPATPYGSEGVAG